MARLLLKVSSVLLGVMALLFSGLTIAAEFPDRPIKIIVGYTPGGSADMVARAVAVPLSRFLGQPVVIDNKPGSGQIIAAQSVSRSPADGYTLLFGSSSLAISASLYKEAKLNLTAEFAPVASVVTTPLMVSTNRTLPVSDFKGLVSYLRQRPNTFYGTSGNGSAGHLAAEDFKRRAGVDITHVPYKGSAPMLNGLMAGEIDLTFDSVGSGIALGKAGKVRLLAVTGSQRIAVAPDLPTVAELGYPGFEASGWYGLLAPNGTPKAIVAKLAAAIEKTMAMPDVIEALASSGNIAAFMGPSQFEKVFGRDVEKYRGEAARLGLKAE